MLERLLNKLGEQTLNEGFSFSISVADNDSARSAESVVSAFAEQSNIIVQYSCEPDQNIAKARNLAISHAEGDYIAFIDDDEFPDPDWLAQLVRCCSENEVAGVLGPVRPFFETSPPNWVIKGGFCDRPEYETGKRLQWTECRTGNVLFKISILKQRPEPFDPNFGTGGEDMKFFRQVMGEGNQFIWCNEAVVYESVPSERITRRYMFKRALLRGRNILKHSSGRLRYVLISLVAVPIYLIITPIAFLLGQHHFVKFAIKLCDHGGRLLAVAGINPVAGRSA